MGKIRDLNALAFSRVEKYDTNIAVDAAGLTSLLRKKKIRLSRGYDETTFRILIRSAYENGKKPETKSTDTAKRRNPLSFLQAKEKSSNDTLVVADVMDVISKRFCNYSKFTNEKTLKDSHSFAGPVLDVGSLGLILDDMFRLRNSKSLARRLLSKMNTHNTGYVTYDEFLSFISLDWLEICEIGQAMKRMLSNRKSCKNMYVSIAGRTNKNINSKLLAGFVKDGLQISLTPGEAETLTYILGHSYEKFQRYMISKDSHSDSESDDDIFHTGENNFKVQKRPIKKICVSTSKSDDIRLRKQRFIKLEPAIRKGFRGKNIGIWIKRHKAEASKNTKQKRKKNRTRYLDRSSDTESSDSHSDDSSISDALSDSDGTSDSNSVGSNESESSHEDNKYDNDSYIRENKAAVSKADTTLSYIVVNQRSKDAGLVADGFRCVEKSLGGVGQFSTPLFLWYKDDSIISKNKKEEINDPILDIAITSGWENDLKSSIWSPPFRGYKRIQTRIGKGKYLWYLKEDITYKQEQVSERSSYRMNFDNSLKTQKFSNALRESVRHQVRSLISETAARKQIRFQQALNSLFEPTRVFKGISTKKEYLSKKEFTLVLHNVGIQLEAKDIALIFHQLDSTENGFVHKQDVIDFFMLNDEEILKVCRKLRRQLLTDKQNKHTKMRKVFEKLDRNGDGKLSPADFQSLLRRSGFELTSGEVQRLVDNLDIDGSGYVEFEEFAAFIKQKNKLSLKNKRQKMLGKEVRKAARIIYEFSIKLAILGDNNGKIDSNRPKWERAWKQLAAKGGEVHFGKNDALTRNTLNSFLDYKGCRLRSKDLDNLICVITSQPRSTKKRLEIDYESFVEFLSHYVPREAKSRSKSETVRDKKTRKGTVDEFVGALRDELKEFKTGSYNPNACNYLSFFGFEKRSKVPVEALIKKLRNRDTESDLLSSHYELISTLFDTNYDGWVTNNDIANFIGDGISQKKSRNDVKDKPQSGISWTSSSASSSDGSSTSYSSSPEYDSSEERGKENFETKENNYICSKDVWWLKPSSDMLATKSEKQEEFQKTRSIYNEDTERIKKNTVRKKWLKHMEKIRAIKATEQTSEVKRVMLLNSFDISTLQAALEEAAQKSKGPLNLEKQFSKYDKLGDGFVLPREFRKVLHRNHINIPNNLQASLAHILTCSNFTKREKRLKIDYRTFCKLGETASKKHLGQISKCHSRISNILKGTDYMYACETFDRFGEGRITKTDFDKAMNMIDVDFHTYDLGILLPLLEKNDDGWLYYTKLEEIVSSGRDILESAKPSRGSQNLPDLENAQLKLAKKICTERKASSDQLNIVEYFEEYDTAGHGIVSSDQFRTVILSLLGNESIKFVETEIDKVCALNEEKKNRINYVNFCNVLESFSYRSICDKGKEVLINKLRNEIRQAEKIYGTTIGALFTARDGKFSGNISRFDFKYCLGQLGLELEAFELKEAMEMVQSTNGYLVNYNEFLSIINTDPVLDITDLQRMLQNALYKANFKHQFFDLRKVFRVSDDYGFVSRKNFCRGVGILEVVVSDNDVNQLYDYLKASETGLVHMDEISEFLDYDEEKYDNIATKCYQRFIDLERQGLSIRQEFRIHDKDSSNLVSPEMFRNVIQSLGLPLSRAEIWLIFKRFMDPSNRHDINYKKFLDMCLARRD